MIATLHDRDAELTTLGERLVAARTGDGGLLVVEGPAGIGKSTLLGAAIEAARGAGMAVLLARGNPLEQDFSFGLARQAFAPLQPTEAWTQLCSGPASLAERALTTGVPAPAGGVDALHAAAHGLFWLTANQAARTPTLLCVDDVHWADLPSLRWLVGLARRVDELPLAMVLSLRSGEPVADRHMLGELLACAADSVRPAPLGVDAVTRLVELARPATSPGFARACHAATGGNPFLLTTLLGHLAGGEVAADESAIVALGRVDPDHIGRWVEQQLCRLPDGAHALAQALSVLGPSATLRQAAALAGRDLDQAASLVDAMRRTGIVTAEPGLVLAHPVVAAALYAGLGASERGLWHARAARLIAAEQGDPERAALHVLRSEPAGDPAATALLTASAHRANARGAPEAAATYLRRALAEPPATDAAVADVRLGLALALAAGRQPGARELAREVVALIDAPATRAEAALRCARALALAGHGDVAIAVHQSILDRPEGVPAEVRARIEAELAATAWTDGRTKPLAHEVLRRTRAEPPAVPLWQVNAAIEAVFAGRPAQEVSGPLRSVLDSGVLVGETDSLLPTVAGLGLIAIEELGPARRLCDTIVTDATARGWISTAAHGQFLRALVLLPTGAVGEATVDARAAFEFKRSSETPLAGVLWGLYPLIDALLEGGQPDAAEAAITTIDLSEPPEHSLTWPLFLQSRARLRQLQDRQVEALADLRAAATCWTGLDIRHPTFVTWRSDAVRTLLALGERTEAAQLASEHLVLAERAGVPGVLGGALRVNAMVAAGSDREHLLRRAVETTAGSAARLQHGYALLELGGTLRRANRRTEACESLRAALDLAATGGAVRLADLALAELHAAGARPRRAAQTGSGALTDAERQVARLAAQGLTNREISLRLALSRRTIETHLAHAYQKLDIHSRGELSDALPT